MEPWWKVNMGSSYCVGRVVIVNRAALRERLTGAVVRIGSSQVRKENAACGTLTHELISASREMELVCNIEGQYLTIEIPEVGGYLFLHVCEVEAFDDGRCEREN